METFINPRELTKNPHFNKQRQKSLLGLSDITIDTPIVEIIYDFNRLPCCFTLQCCYGHFVYAGRKDSHNLEPLPDTDIIDEVEYRIAYVAFCVDNSESGRELLQALKKITAIDPDNIQLCSAEWFWERQVNSYALQVEPDRHKDKDSVILDYSEALKIEKTRNEFYSRLGDFVKRQVTEDTMSKEDVVTRKKNF